MQRLTIEACVRLRILVLICLFVLFVIIIVAHLLVLVVIILSLTLASLPGSGTRVLICSFVYLIIYLFVLAPSWCRRHQIRQNRTPPHEPIVFVFLVLFSFCSLLFYINCVFYTKKELLLFVFVIVVNSPLLQSLSFETCIFHHPQSFGGSAGLEGRLYP